MAFDDLQWFPFVELDDIILWQFLHFVKIPLNGRTITWLVINSF